jgi:hypothetical protein
MGSTLSTGPVEQEEEDTVIEMDIRDIDPNAAMMQYYRSTGELPVDSAFYQMVHRHLSRAGPFFRNRNWLQPVGNYAVLKDFCQTLQNCFGAGAASLMHGAAKSDPPSQSTRAEAYFSTKNFGTFHPRNIRRSNPAMYLEEGMQVDDILNFAHMVMETAPWSCFSPSAGKRVIVITLQRDGMAIKRGLETCSATLTNVGEAGKVMTFKEAGACIKLSDSQVRRLCVSKAITVSRQLCVVLEGSNRAVCVVEGSLLPKHDVNCRALLM